MRSSAPSILAVVALIAFTGLLVELRDTARSAAPSGTTVGDVERAFRQRMGSAETAVTREMRDIGCEQNAGSSSFTCHVFLSPDGSRGLLERYLLRPISSCTGKQTCLRAGAGSFTIASSGETKVDGTI
jgi:hypothetical protein